MNQDHLDLLASEGWRDLLRDMIVPYAFDQRSPADLGDAVLEVGPGPGLTTDLLSPQVAEFTAIELDPELAAHLSERYADRESVTVVEGDATAMPFEDRRFSGAVSFTMLHHVPTTTLQDALLAEVHRVLRPGGLFVASDSVASPELEDLHTDDVYNPVDPASLQSRLERTGFVDIEVDWHDFGWRAHARRATDS